MKLKPSLWAPALRHGELTNDLHLLLPLWEGAGTTVHDISGHGRHDSFRLGTEEWVATEIGMAVDLAGDNEAVAYYGNGVLDIHSQNPHSFFVLARAPTGLGAVDCFLVSSGTANYVFYWNDGDELKILSGASINSVHNPYYADDGLWHTYVASYDGTTMRCYIDGELVITDAGTPTARTAWNFGGDSQGNSRGWIGQIGLVGAWGRALAAGAINQLASDPFCLFRRPDPMELWSPATQGAAPAGLDIPAAHRHYATLRGE